MITKEICQRVLELCLKTGGDFAEIFSESTINNYYELTSGKVTRAETTNLYGASIRILKGNQEVFGYTNDISLKGLEDLATRLSKAYTDSELGITFELKEMEVLNNNVVLRKPSSLSNEEKINYLENLYNASKDYSNEITQIICNLVDEEQNVLIANTLGKYVKDYRNHVRIAETVVASNNGVMQTASDNFGRNQGYEMFDNFDLDTFSKNIAEVAIKMLHADEMVGGNMTVIIHNAFGGVLLHEACVHSLEATSVAKGSSVFCGKLGQKIASDIVTAVDDGTLTNAWGSLNIDDEGNTTKRNVLIENGILKSYLVDYRNSRKMNHEITGSGRRQNYKYSPTSRMTNTFFTPGKDKFEDIISKTKFGLFAKKMGGGSVNPATGEFNFAVNEGYMIEDGKITKPVRGATLVGSGASVLLNIDMIADNLDYGYGMCGSQSGSIPTIVGQPTIRVQNMTVGGRGEK